jgi:hypothetical protein
MVFRGVLTGTIAIMVAVSETADAQITRKDLIAIERHRVIEQANRYLSEPPVTITATRAPRGEGGPHDFYSEGDYWWPDPADSSKPYIRRDGETNPANFDAHRAAMRRLSVIVPALVAAYEITGDRRYAQHAVAHLRAWFDAHAHESEHAVRASDQGCRRGPRHRDH